MSTYPLNTPSQPTLSPHPFNPPYYPTLSIHPINKISRPIPTLLPHPLNPPNKLNPYSLVGWALCYGMGYAFDFVATGKPGLNESDNPALRTKPQYEINSSAAFALLMHRCGIVVIVNTHTRTIPL